VDGGLDGVDQLLVRRSEVRAARIGRVVAVAGRRETAVKVGSAGKTLADDRGPDRPPVAHDELTVRLVAEERLRETRHDEGIHEAQQDGRHDGHQGGDQEILADAHGQASLNVVMMTSTILMPTNGAMMPPTP